MRPDEATCRQVRVRATIFALVRTSSVTFRFQASADGSVWREIDSFGTSSIGIEERTYPAPVEPNLRVLSEPIGAGCAAVVRTEILRGPEPEGPRVERGN